MRGGDAAHRSNNSGWRRPAIYDKSAKRYAAQTHFRPLLAKPNATRFLGELRLVEVGLLSVEDTLLSIVPSFDATPVPERRIDPLVLRAVLFAMRGRPLSKTTISIG